MRARAAHLFPFAVLLAFVVGCDRDAVVSGKVVLQGIPPPEITINFDPTSARLQTNSPVTTRHYVVAADGGLANVVVSLKSGLTNSVVSMTTNEATMSLTHALYQPYMIAVNTGQVVRIWNLDPVLHNVHLMPPRGSSNREKSITMPTKSSPPPAEKFWRRILRMLRRQPAPAVSGGVALKFASPDIFVRLKCDVHPWEFGYIAVFDHPYFALTDARGEFTLPPLPPGKYVLEARHLKAGTSTQEIVIDRGQSQRLEIKMKVPAKGLPAQ